MADNVIKIYVEDGLEASLHSIGTEVYSIIDYMILICPLDY